MSRLTGGTLLKDAGRAVTRRYALWARQRVRATRGRGEPRAVMANQRVSTLVTADMTSLGRGSRSTQIPTRPDF
ncbi:hypothetical protein NL676_033728 [Syzygium grande]|nr:hypothetical protein NL676_033728 [Syzygium grande]